MVDVDLLRTKIANAGLNIPMLAGKMQINPATLYRRMSHTETFTIGEVTKITSILNLSSDESTAIFFNCVVA